jgi:hypothetical protein
MTTGSATPFKMVDEERRIVLAARFIDHEAAWRI